MNEDFDGSALRELLTPAVADRGKAAAPADAIVAAGRRRVVGRRVAVAGGALAIVAAVPVAATAIAAGPGKAAKADASVAGAAKPAPTLTATPIPTAKPTPTVVPTTTTTTTPTLKLTMPEVKPDAPLPTTPLLLASGTLDGKHWTVSGVGSAGNNDLTAKDHCLKLLTTEDGRAMDPSFGEHLLYCLPGAVQGYQEAQMGYDIKGGAGTLEIGTISSDVTKIVAHIDGATAPITVATVPAPGVTGTAIYIVPVPSNDGARTSFDKYNAAGEKIGTFSNTSPMPMQ